MTKLVLALSTVRPNYLQSDHGNDGFLLARRMQWGENKKWHEYVFGYDTNDRDGKRKSIFLYYSDKLKKYCVHGLISDDNYYSKDFEIYEDAKKDFLRVIKSNRIKQQ
jgi:hypothetical protein